MDQCRAPSAVERTEGMQRGRDECSRMRTWHAGVSAWTMEIKLTCHSSSPLPTASAAVESGFERAAAAVALAGCSLKPAASSG